MQLFALDGGKPVFASQALPHRRYQCPECSLPVFLRKGPHRQPHYYHRDLSSYCRQNQKTLEHLHVQQALLQQLPQGEAFLEHAFPSIHRIADVAWLSQGIVFEIQCSPISALEVAKRTADYQSLGLKIVWILHDKRFNKKKLSQAEQHLRHQTCYYTNYSKKGEGIFYDQFEVCQGAHRPFKGPPLPLSFQLPITSLPQLPVLQSHTATWQVHFRGDLLDQLHRIPPQDKIHLENWEIAFQQPSLSQAIRLWHYVQQLYIKCLDWLIKALGAN